MDGDLFTHVLRIAPEQAADPDDLLQREWLLTNGSGSYAMGTALGCNTRRYHGLLVAAGGLPGTRPPVGRIVALNQMWEQVVLSKADGASLKAGGSDPSTSAIRHQPYPAEQTLEFATLAFRGMEGQRVFSPRGHTMLRRFDRGLSVRWIYQWGGIGFERRLLLHWKQQAITLRYRLTGLDDADLRATLRLRPMVTLRDFHGLRHRQAAPAYELDDHQGEYFTIQDEAQAGAAAGTGPALCLHSSHGSFHADTSGENWWRHVFYQADAERGQDDQEDHYLPAALSTPIADGVDVAVTVALGREPVDPIADMGERAAHLRPMAAAIENAECGMQNAEKTAAANSAFRIPNSALANALAIAADDFIVDRTIAGEELSTVLAGYPWFFDWGRDTFIALPGLLLCTGRFDEARQTLRTFSDAIFDGLVPNRFDDYDDAAAHYNTVDASLWFIRAAVQYVEATGDEDAWQDWLAAACLRVVDAYVTGTNYGIVMDTDGLITAGNPQTQLTWMDAQCGDVVFTPRWGKAVEINALWHSVLVDLSRRSTVQRPGGARGSGSAGSYARLAEKTRSAFARTFWNEAAGCLYDHVTVDERGRPAPDGSIRPNQVLAVSLPHSPLPPAKQKRVLAVVKEKLLTRAGLRTLSPDDPAYQGRYTGPQPQRDAAYHQGTVWPWLIGPYAEAVLRVGRFSVAARAEARAAIAPLLHQLTGEPAGGGCLGQLSEIHEADTLRPVGCPAQAWSVAEVLRLHQLIES